MFEFFLVVLFVVLCFLGVVIAVTWSIASNRARSQMSVKCPHCATIHERSDVLCQRCQSPLVTSKLKLQRADLIACGRQLKRMFRAETITPEVHDKLARYLRKEFREQSWNPDQTVQMPAALALVGSSSAKPTAKPKSEKAAKAQPISNRRPGEEVKAKPNLAASNVDAAGVIVAEVIGEAVESTPSQPPMQSRPISLTPPPPVSPNQPQLTAIEPKREPIATPSKPKEKPESVHPLDRPVVEEPRQPSVARRSLADIFSAFMEEKNIRWGELLAGLLILGSTIGLIVSLREPLSDIPYAPSLAALMVTAAMFLAGIYTLKHWKIATTSRGLLIIALLMVPLTLLTGLVKPNDALDGNDGFTMYQWQYWAAVVFGGAALGWITYRGSRLLNERHWPWLAGGIGIPALCMMLLDRLAVAWNPWTTSMLMLPVVGSLVGVTYSTLFETTTTDDQDEDASNATLQPLYDLMLLGGMVFFNVLCCLGFYFHATQGSFADSAMHLAGTVSLISATILAAGAALTGRGRGSNQAIVLLPGPILDVLGVAGVVVSLGVAAANVPLFAIIALTQTVLLGLLARRVSSPAIGYAATASLTLAYLGGVCLALGLAPAAGEVSRAWVFELFQHGPVAVAIAGWALVLGAIGAVLNRQQTQLAAEVCLRSSLAVVVISLITAGLVSLLRPEDSTWTTGLLTAYGLACLVAGSKFCRREISAAGAVFTAAALANALVLDNLFQPLEIGYRWAYATCGYATLMFAWRVAELAIGSHGNTESGEDEHTHPLLLASLAGAVIAVPIVIYVGTISVLDAAAFFAWISLLPLVKSLLLRASGHFLAFRVGTTVAASYLAIGLTQQWYPAVPLISMTHAMHLIIAWSVLSLVWFALETAGRRVALLNELLGERGELARDAFHYLPLAAMGCAAVLLVGAGIGAELRMADGDSLEWFSSTSYAPAFWIAWGLLTAALAGRSYESITDVAHSAKARTQAAIAALAVTALLPIAISLHAAPDLGVASALRWSFAVYAIVGAAVTAVGLRTGSERVRELIRQMSDPLLAIGAVPVCGITLLAFGGILSGTMPAGPSETIWLGRISATVLYIVPLAAVVVAMTVHGAALRRPRTLAIGSATLQASLALAICLGTHLDPELSFDVAFVIKLIQFSAIALAVYGFAWFGIQRWRWADDRDPAFDWQVGIAAVVSGSMLAVLGTQLFLFPAGSSKMLLLSGLLTWLAIGLSATLIGVAWLRSTPATESPGVALRLTPATLALGSAVALLVLTSATVVGRQPQWTSDWIGPHLLQVGLMVIAVVHLAITATGRGIDATLRQWQPITLVTVALAFAARGLFADPLAPSWQVGVIGCSIAVLGWLGIAHRNVWLTYATTALAASIPVVFYINDPGELLWTGFASLAAGGAAALAWAFVELALQRREEKAPARFGVQLTYPWFLMLTTVAGLFVAKVHLGNAFHTDAVAVQSAACLAILLALGVVTLWDRWAQAVLPQLHLTGIAWLFWGLAISNWPFENMLLALAIGVTVYHTLIAWFARRAIPTVGRQLKIPSIVNRLVGFDQWMVATAMAANFAIFAFSFAGVLLYGQRWQAILCGLLPAMMALQAMLFIRPNRVWLRPVVLMLASAAAVLLSWADLHANPIAVDAWLQRLIRVVIIAASLAFLYGVVGARRLAASSPWRGVLMRASTTAMIVSVCLLLPILAMEVATFGDEGLPIDTPHASAVAVSLIGVMVTLFVFALSKDLDPFDLGETKKQIYIYAAEATLLLIGGQIYLMAPYLFGGVMRQYWPLIIMAIAFVGVAISEVARRNHIRVLAEPFHRTTVLLPVLPALGMWIETQHSTPYSLVMFVVGCLYMVLAISRKSAFATAAAAVAGNIALWSFMHEAEKFSFFDHPQFWLIPPAMSVLIAAQSQREKLAPAQLATVRYLAMTVIYISSLSEVFIGGFEGQLWGPMILATFAVAGALAGVAMRVRAFLYTGTCFLAISIVSMVSHAYRMLDNHAAVWWVFGIVTGMAILLMFALFEKNREQFQHWVHQVRQWER